MARISGTRTERRPLVRVVPCSSSDTVISGAASANSRNRGRPAGEVRQPDADHIRQRRGELDRQQRAGQRIAPVPDLARGVDRHNTIRDLAIIRLRRVEDLHAFAHQPVAVSEFHAVS